MPLLSSFSPDLAFLAEVARVILKSGFFLENAVSTLLDFLVWWINSSVLTLLWVRFVLSHVQQLTNACLTCPFGLQRIVVHFGPVLHWWWSLFTNSDGGLWFDKLDADHTYRKNKNTLLSHTSTSLVRETMPYFCLCTKVSWSLMKRQLKITMLKSAGMIEKK